MGIVTKRGDRGRTSLFLGGRVAKDNRRIELIGSLDELCSFIGIAKSLVKKKTTKSCLESIQKDLLCICCEVATLPRFLNRVNERITISNVRRLEKIIDKTETNRGLKKCGFCLPGGSSTSSILDVSRAVCRRAERRTVSLFKRKALKNHFILMYLNRLSDLLYLLARTCETKTSFIK